MALEMGVSRASYESSSTVPISTRNDGERSNSNNSSSSSSSNRSRGSSFRRASETGQGIGAGPAWWEGIARARKAIDALASALGHRLLPEAQAEYLKDSERPARRLLESTDAARAVATALAAPDAGVATDPLCRWLYDTFQSSSSHDDPDLQLLVLRFVPLLAGVYLCRLASSASAPAPAVAGFEAVFLVLYSAEANVRNGRPVLVHVPDIAQPSLYHVPRATASASAASMPPGQLCGALEPLVALKSTKRGAVVGAALDAFYGKIAHMPARAKLELCRYVQAWAGQDCPCVRSLDEDPPFSAPSPCLQTQAPGAAAAVQELPRTSSGDHGGGAIPETEDFVAPHATRITFPWEVMRPVLRILGHCLLSPLLPQEVRDAAGIAARSVYARAMHELLPEAVLASRSLVRLDVSARQAAAAAASAQALVPVSSVSVSSSANSDDAGSSVTTPTKAKQQQLAPLLPSM